MRLEAGLIQHFLLTIAYLGNGAGFDIPDLVGILADGSVAAEFPGSCRADDGGFGPLLDSRGG